ncbi:hypothetical protein [Candidatus Nitrosocosmicus sp. SS]|uniref:hypothetical protein n=1 Tax=Candidatus Nitrosocosmicus agrestis TaxID=2563600 RepID=UPI00122E2A60|nr:hypothetical protein [Candidatus Nitrosocosmicus sp. SS]KAA2281146.1 hypothetical protein F1Z66_09490 [Candidatus Nitrosocosmicus sp. SS]KAF0869446.1 hypothetical protein E5N71_05230 [Candidatus Nitrosocosmicus sp. SS]
MIVKGGLKAIDCHKKVFDAKVRGPMMTPDGKSVALAEFEIGDSKIMFSDEFSDMKMVLPSTMKGRGFF